MSKEELRDWIRRKLGDTSNQNLLPGEEFSDDDIDLAADEAVDLFNEVEPQSSYSQDQILSSSAKLIFIDAVTLQLVYNKILYYMRNAINAEGEMPSVEAQRLQRYANLYGTLLQQVRNRIIAWKVARNAQNAFQVFDFGDIKDSNFW